MVGFNGTAAGGTLPDDGTIQIAFDRLLDPASVTRQSFSLSDDSGNYPEEVVTYDPILRVVTLSTNSGGAWLTQGATYKVVMGQAAASDTTGLTGPKAIDGATLTASVVETFQAVASAGTESEYRAMDLCNDVLPVFQNDCSSTNCHGAPQDGQYPREGLALTTPLGIASTAISRASQESNTGAQAGAGTAAGAAPFGVDMPIIDPGNPGNSWLIYKLLLAAGNPTVSPDPVSCGGTSVSPLPAPALNSDTANPNAPTVLLSDSERSILSELVIGEQMPYPPNTALGLDELERISAWIAQGATVVQCPNCPGP